MKNKTFSMLGWYGVLAILMAYALLSFGYIESKSYAYQLLNLSGAVGLGLETWKKKDFQPAILNAIWALIALVVIATIMLRP